MRSRDGYFGPDSLIRRLGNSPLVPLLGGGPAVLLQVAHPLVAAGVVEHSGYDRNLWRRLVRTMQALYFVAYGSKDEADRAGAAVRTVHRYVHGRTSEQLGRFPAGTRYSASDPELQLWVHATLVESSLAAYNRFVRRLTPDEEEAYYRDMALVARIFGTPASVVPRTLAEFREYFAAQLDGADICVTDPAREVADVILAARVPAPLRLIVPAHRLSTAALLPRRLREEYGLAWSRAHAAVLDVAARSVRVAAVPLFLVSERVAPPTTSLAA